MKNRIWLWALLLFSVAQGQQKLVIYSGKWRAELHRQDGQLVVFGLDIKKQQGQWQVFIINGKERIQARNIVQKSDSLNFAMPVFESEFRTAIQPDGTLKGTWYKGTALQTQQWLFTASPGKTTRFDATEGKAETNISGRWSVLIERATGGTRPAIGEFVQQGNRLTGTFLTPSGDYRYLEGIVTGKTMKLSVFDGAHAYYFTAKINEAGKISEGFFYSGYAGVEKWTALKNPGAVLPDVGNIPVLKKGFETIDFSFRDLNRETVSFRDDRFKNKVVIVQLMGSWCPNCLDETRFLSEFYRKNKQRGVEVVALAYEYSTDYERSRSSLLKFQQLYQVEYPMLVTGAWVNDSLRTEKTLPQITPVKVFPTTIYIGKDGKVKKIDAGFYGPGTGIHHEVFRKEFNATVEELLSAR